MPELPEVETVRRGLERCLMGVRLEHVHVLQSMREPIDAGELEAFCAGKTIVDVRRRAKYLVVVFMTGEGLVLHLGMTGSFQVEETLPQNILHCCVSWDLSNGCHWHFVDIRRFGIVRICREDVREAWPECLSELGPEPLGEEFTADVLLRAAKGRRLSVKELIMDQRIVVGVGNIYASESLFRAGIDPRQEAERLTKPQAVKLVAAIREVLQEAIAAGGTTISDFRTLDGSEGGFSVKLKVYGQEGAKCENCGGTIERVVQGGRSTFFCPHCQKKARKRKSN